MSLLTLTAPGETGVPRLVRAVVAPQRALMLLSLVADIPGQGEVELIASPPLDEAEAKLGAGDPNTAFAFGGAVLAPFANRLSGRVEGGLVHTQVAGLDIAVPANGWKGRYAIHGLILGEAVEPLSLAPDRCFGAVRLDRPEQWPSVLVFEIGWSLTAQSLDLAVRARNDGDEAAPVGLGWHPYFNVPSGRRDQVRLHIPAHTRALVDDYHSVMPTGGLEDVAGTPYDFRAAQGRALGGLYLDDCFMDLERGNDGVVCAMFDEAAQVGVKLTSRSPAVRAVQTYAPPDRPIVVMEPQFNLADPFGGVWNGMDTGMVLLQPGRAVDYDVSIVLDAR